jgi:hypothetical protein
MDQANLGGQSSGHRPFDRQTPEIALVEGAYLLTALGCLKCQVGIGEIHVPVAGQLDRPNDQLPTADSIPGQIQGK